MALYMSRSLPRHVPDEILLMIFTCFKLPFPQVEEIEYLKTLRALVRCSKRFHRIARPLLYHKVIVGDIYGRHALIRTLSRQPNLGQLIHNFALYDKPHVDNYAGPTPVSRIVKNAIESPQSKFALPPVLRQRILNSGDGHGSEVALLLAFLPNLKYLFLNLPLRTIVVDIFQYVIRNISPRPKELLGASGDSSVQLLSAGHFSELQDIALGNYMFPRECMHYINSPFRPLGGSHVVFPRKNDQDQLLVSAMLKLPTLTSFSIGGMLWSESMLNDVPTVLGLRDIDVDARWLSSRCLVNILSRCPKLRSLRLTTPDDYDNQHFSISMEAVGNFLRDSKDPCLETLVIEEPEYSHSPYTDIIGPLRKLKKLRTLHIPLYILIGHHYPKISFDKWLPDSIESIHITEPRAFTHPDFNWCVDNQVKHMISKETRPNLREVRTSCRHRGYPYGALYLRNVGRPGWTFQYRLQGHYTRPWPIDPKPI